MNRIWILLGGLLVSSQALGWGATGHRVAGQIAEGYLSPEARLAVEEVLGVESLAQASTWADFMRSDPDEFWQTTANPWHYVTVPPGNAYREVGAPEQGDAASALDRFTYQLRDAESTLQQRALALRFIVHIVGDLHQPLHVGNGEDRGGNDVDIIFFGQPTNLHRLWDSQMIDRRQLSYSEMAEWLAAEITPDDFRAWNTPDPLVWIEESATLRDRIYPDDDDLGWGYSYEWSSTIDVQLKKAGVRTAAYLNDVFRDRQASTPDAN